MINDVILSTKDKCWEMVYENLGDFADKCKNLDTNTIGKMSLQDKKKCYPVVT